MGQYYVVANLDKREILTVNGTLPGQKLMEIAQIDIESRAVLNQIAEKWKGDHVYLVGDYAEPKHALHQYHQALQDWTDRLHLTESLHHYARDNFQRIDGDTNDNGYRFIYNHATKEYIDMAHCPSCCDGTDWRQGFIAPLPLLIAMGNGEGGGDYYNSSNDHYVGSWCDTITSVEITKEPKDELKYKEFHPDFGY